MNTAKKLQAKESLFDSLKTKFFVDIGASNDENESQTEFLLHKGWNGVFFEADNGKFEGLSKRLTGFDCKVVNSKITPENILSLLKEHKVPKDFYLSLDIDSYDYYVLEKILSEYTPQLIISEINEKIPPPIKFSVSYKDDWSWDTSHFYGYSIAMLEKLLNEKKYKIELLDSNNVVLKPGIQEQNLKEIYNKGYLLTEDRKQRFYYNENFENIYSLDDDEKINFINNFFNKYKGNYIIEI